MSFHGLSKKTLKIIKEILSIYAEKIEKVCLFGSRAQGTYRNNSDIDIVVYGSLNEADLDRIWTLFDESFLPIKVDINIFDLVDYPPLKDHITKENKILFSHKDLLK